MNQNLIQAIKSKENIIDRGITFIRSTTEDEMVPYNILYKKARIILKQLQDLGVVAHDKVILQLEDDEDFIITFWACILGKIIPVPLPVESSKEGIQKIFRISDKLDRPLIAISSERFESLCQEDKGCLANKYIIIDRKQAVEESIDLKEIIDDEVDNDETAFIQFSSGSTGEPKGVVITHGNVMALIRGMNDRLHVGIDEPTVYWMPLSHSTALLAHLFNNVYNLKSYLIQTQLFLMEPSIWFEKISQYKGVFTCCPNFGYKHCMQMLKNKKLKNVDLSCLKIILNGAEPISKEVCDLFVKTFSIYGLNKNVIVPTYGLSEATVVVTLAHTQEPMESFRIDINAQVIGEKIKYIDDETVSDGSIEVVSVGTPIKDVRIRIVNEQGVDIGEDRTGYVEVQGNTVCKGYYGIDSKMSGLFDDEGWLNTGDIGFIHEGKLIISGRSKDVIFVNGKNYYCSDIENVLLHEGILEECVVVALYNEEKSYDQIAIFVKMNGDDKQATQIASKIKKVVFKYTNLKVDYVILVQQIPRGKSGKIQRDKLQEAYKAGICREIKMSQVEEEPKQDIKQVIKGMDRAELIAHIQNGIEALIGFKIEDLDKNLLEYGIDSIKVPQFKALLEERLNVQIPVSIVFDHPTINQIADYLLGEHAESVEEKQQISKEHQDIAIIGMGCRFPAGANNIELFWEKLINGQEFITDVPWDRKELLKYSNENAEGAVQGGFLEDIALFDPSCFNITPLEAKYMDPQQRILLEVTHEALQCAGINDVKGSNTGVFVGISNNDYLEMCKEVAKEEINNYMITGNMLNIAAGRIGYVFDLHGPIMAIDTACSSSLVAVHEAVKSLKLGECNMAIAGGVNLILSPQGYVGLRKMNALSPSNRCKTFDDSADGYVRSEGCGIIILKRYEDAIKDNDRIWAVIKGSALNHDGRSSGLTAPNGLAQEQVIKKALSVAHMTCEEIDYIETHGTGTKLGDPQEVNALANVFSNISDKKILLGSVKSNMGHTESAAGIASLIKVILALKNRMIPANLHFNEPNKFIDWRNIPFQVIDKNYQWNLEKELTVGISSFGLSGTNVHMILKEFRAPQYETREQKTNILTVSAKKKETLVKEVENYIEYLKHSEEKLVEICSTSNRLRTDEMYKIAWVCEDKESLIQAMQKSLRKGIMSDKGLNGKITFMFDGEESIYMNMGKELYDNNELFKKILDDVDGIYTEVVGKSFKEVLPELDYKLSAKEQIYASVVVFEYALVEMWKQYGIIPEQVFGYGVGEYVAAYTAGIMTIKEAIQLAYEKGKIIGSLPKESESVLIFEDEEVISILIEENKLENLFIASVNSNKNILVVGQKDSMDTLIHRLDERHYLYLKNKDALQPSREKIEGAKEAFSYITKNIKYGLPNKKFISLDIACKEAVDSPSYWDSSIYRITNLYKVICNLEDSHTFIEIGGATTLSSIVTEILGDRALILPSIRKVKGECRQIAEVICELYKHGYHIDWQLLNANNGAQAVKLPNKVYTKKRFWFN